MSVSITKALADTYFGPTNHTKSAMWLAFDDMLRQAAVTEAIRVISQALGESVTGETVVTTDYYQPDYAVYEQALYTLQNSEAIANGEQNGPRYLASQGESRPRKADMPFISPQAKRWLGWGAGSTISVSRG